MPALPHSALLQSPAVTPSTGSGNDLMSEDRVRQLDRIVTKVQGLTSAERQRRMELLSYMDAAVYHWRDRSEHSFLRQRIDAALKDDEARLEVEMIRKTMAQAEGERYTLEANKRTLVNQLRLRFPPLPAEIEQTIAETQDAKKLDEWLSGVVTAKDLNAIGIIPRR
jgi:hypothetical protein